MTEEFDNAEIKVEEGVDLGFEIKDCMFPNLVLQGELLHRSMLCKWMT